MNLSKLSDNAIKKRLDLHPEVREEQARRMARQYKKDMSFYAIAQYWGCHAAWAKTQVMKYLEK